MHGVEGMNPNDSFSPHCLVLISSLRTNITKTKVKEILHLNDLSLESLSEELFVET